MHLFGVRVGHLKEFFRKCTPLLNLLPYFGVLLWKVAQGGFIRAKEPQLLTSKGKLSEVRGRVAPNHWWGTTGM
jgi:hypothetical protein